MHGHVCSICKEETAVASVRASVAAVRESTSLLTTWNSKRAAATGMIHGLAYMCSRPDYPLPCKIADPSVLLSLHKHTPEPPAVLCDAASTICIDHLLLEEPTCETRSGCALYINADVAAPRLISRLLSMQSRSKNNRP